jgi:hypothetical protein
MKTPQRWGVSICGDGRDVEPGFDQNACVLGRRLRRSRRDGRIALWRDGRNPALLVAHHRRRVRRGVFVCGDGEGCRTRVRPERMRSGTPLAAVPQGRTDRRKARRPQSRPPGCTPPAPLLRGVFVCGTRRDENPRGFDQNACVLGRRLRRSRRDGRIAPRRDGRNPDLLVAHHRHPRPWTHHCAQAIAASSHGSTHEGHSPPDASPLETPPWVGLQPDTRAPGFIAAPKPSPRRAVARPTKDSRHRTPRR